MSGIFNKLVTQQVEEQKKALEESKKQNDIDGRSDATASQQDATTSRKDSKTSPTNQTPAQTTPRTQNVTKSDHSVLDESLMGEIVTELSGAEIRPNAISIRMSADEKAYIDDFILDTLRKQKLQGPEVSIAKLMRYALTYLLLKHQQEFVDVLKKTLIKKDSGRLFQWCLNNLTCLYD